jgi:hypothetical protein
MPNVPGMTDTLDFVKNLWGNMNVPGVTAPSLSTDELDKRISDLKAVEAWLNMNLTMLRGTIQALEVQRGTLATLKSMSATMAQAMNQPGAGGAPNPFQSFFNLPDTGGQAAAPQPAGAGAPPAAPQPAQGAQAQAGAGAAPAAELPPSVASMPAAVAWWNLLQDQFKQAVASTMSPEAMAGAAAMAQDAAARFGSAAKPAGEEKPGAAGNAGAQAGAGNGKPRPAKPKTGKS